MTIPGASSPGKAESPVRWLLLLGGDAIGAFVLWGKRILIYLAVENPVTIRSYARRFQLATFAPSSASPRDPDVLSMHLEGARIRLFIIDPQPLIAAALHYLFAADANFDVVGTSQTVKAPGLRGAAPSVVLLCGEHGATALADQVGACSIAVPAAKICVVACHPHPEMVARILAAGADGYAVKDSAPAELIDAVIAIANGGKYVDPRIETGALVTNGAASRARTVNPLSTRETEVLKLIAGGYSNREISIALSLSEKTIKNHISHIFAKLHITARTQAVIHALKTGIA